MSLCAAMADLPANCVPTPHCEEMRNPRPNTTFAAQADDCCTVSSAPIPERLTNVPATVVSPLLVVAHEMVVPVFEADTLAVTPRARSAPSDLQSALCVFLI